jgi:biotin carboxylase
LTFPCVVKAPDRQGQRGLTLVAEPSQLAGALAEAGREARTGSPLVEELVDGPEITVNAVWRGGSPSVLTVTDRVLADAPAFGVALAHVWPSAHATDAAVAASLDAARAIGIANGPSYVQVRVAAGGPRVMEVAARLGGGHDAELCEAALGVDLNRLAIAAALGEDVGTADVSPARDVSDARSTGQVPGRQGAPRKVLHSPPFARSTGQGPGGACVSFLVAPPGELVAVDGLEEAAATEGIVWVRSYRRPGFRFGALRRGADRAGAILAVGASREDALERAGRAMQAVRFQVDADAS